MHLTRVVFGRRGRTGSAATARTAVRVVLLSTLALVSASALASVSHTEPEGATPGSGRGAAAVITAGGSHSRALLRTGPSSAGAATASASSASATPSPEATAPARWATTSPSTSAPVARPRHRRRRHHTCALLDDGPVKCWGDNDCTASSATATPARPGRRRRRDGRRPPRRRPRHRPHRHRHHRRRQPHLRAPRQRHRQVLGPQRLGQLGLGDTITRGDGPGEMGDNLPAVDLGTGRTATADHRRRHPHLRASSTTARVKCWGRNGDGQLGYGDTDLPGRRPGEMGDSLPPSTSAPAAPPPPSPPASCHTCALLDNGTVKCWGDNAAGQLGYGDTDDRGDGPGEMGDSLPAVDLGTGRTATAISRRRSSTPARCSTTPPSSAGASNVCGQLGYGDTDDARRRRRGDGRRPPPVNLGAGRTAIAPSPPAATTRARCSTTTP